MDKTSSADDSKERLLRAAKIIFAEKGFDGATVKELSDAAQVNVSLISYHFGGKEGLYRTCLEQFGVARLAAAQRLLQEPENEESFILRLKMFSEEVINCHLEETELTKIIHRECDSQLPVAGDIFRNTFMRVFETLCLFFSSAQSKGILRKDLDPVLVARVFWGSLLWSLKNDEMGKKYFGVTLRDPVYRKQFLQNILEVCAHGSTSS